MSSREEDVAKALTMLRDVSEILHNTFRNPDLGNRASSQHSSPDRVSNSSSMRQSAPTSSVLAEVRRSFSPYQIPNNSSRARGGRRQLLSTPSTSRSRSRLWSHKVFCLYGPEDVLTPGNNRSCDLFDYGLGEKFISIDINIDSNNFKLEICKLYPKLENHCFELLRAFGGGSGKRLARIVENDEIPLPRVITTLIGQSTVYVRPYDEIYEINRTLRRENEGRSTDDTTIDVDSSLILEDSISGSQSPSGLQTSSLQNEMEDELITLSAWKDKLYASFSDGDTTKIFIQRDDFLHGVLGVYKKEINLYRQPEVIFAGEAGADAGALTKEYFYCGFESLTSGKFNGRLPLFEGSSDRKLPTSDASLLRSGVYKYLGKFMLHAAIHSGHGFIGLCDCVVEYLMAEMFTHETPLQISVDDVPNYNIKNTLLSIEKWKEGEVPAQDILNNTEGVALESGFNEKICLDNLKPLSEHLLYHFVIEKRRSQLESLKSGFKDELLSSFISGKEYMYRDLFPKWSSFGYPPQLVISKIKCDDNLELIDNIKEFIYEKCENSENMKRLLIAWTGFPEIPETGLKVTLIEDEEFIVQTCFNEMFVPKSYDKKMIYEKLSVLINNYTGFGVI